MCLIAERIGLSSAAIVVVLLIATGGVLSAAAHSSAAQNESDTVPDPLVSGSYADQPIDAGETLTYDAELEQGEYVEVTALFDLEDDLEVRIDDPDGNAVGETFGGNASATAALFYVRSDGTYTVEVENAGNDTAFDLHVDRSDSRAEEPDPETGEIPDPLESGAYLGEIDTNDTLTYDIELAEGDGLNVLLAFAGPNDLEATVTDPDGNLVGETLGGDDHAIVILQEVATDGTYTVEIDNEAGDARFQLEVDHWEGTGGVEPDDVPEPLESGEYDDQPIEAGDTLTYDADLTQGDTLHVVVAFDPEHDLEATITDPDGTVVGESDHEDDQSVTSLSDVERDGTYTVAIENAGVDATFSLSVDHDNRPPKEPDPGPEIPEPLETGLYTDRPIEAGDTLTYDAELSNGDIFLFGAGTDGGGNDLEVTLVGPDGTPAGTEIADDEFSGVSLIDVETAGTYTVAIENTGEDASMILDVYHGEVAVLADGVQTGSIDPDDERFYAIELSEGEDLQVTLTADDSNLQVTVLDPVLEAVAVADGGDQPTDVTVADADASGFYLVWLLNDGIETIEYDLEVARETDDGGDPGAEDGNDQDDEGDGQDEGDDGQTDEGNDSNTDDERDDDPEGSDSTPGFGALVALVSIATLIRRRRDSD